jgi:hypothetical protein
MWRARLWRLVAQAAAASVVLATACSHAPRERHGIAAAPAWLKAALGTACYSPTSGWNPDATSERRFPLTFRPVAVTRCTQPAARNGLAEPTPLREVASLHLRELAAAMRASSEGFPATCLARFGPSGQLHLVFIDAQGATFSAKEPRDACGDIVEPLRRALARLQWEPVPVGT